MARVARLEAVAIEEVRALELERNARQFDILISASYLNGIESGGDTEYEIKWHGCRPAYVECRR
jgi:hypothetical protein